jgi:hypothetical protein
VAKDIVIQSGRGVPTQPRKNKTIIKTAVGLLDGLLREPDFIASKPFKVDRLFTPSLDRRYPYEDGALFIRHDS